MKKVLLLTGFLLIGSFLSAQQLDGIYKNGTDSITFSNGKVNFRISGFGGLSSVQVGEGTYEFGDGFLFIHTSDYPGDKSSFETLDGSSNDTCIVYTVSLQNYSVQGILVESRNKSGRLIQGKVTDYDGKIIFTSCDKTAAISASSLGYDPITFDYARGNNYRIRLAENIVIENSTVAFGIRIIDEETISLMMLSDNFNLGKDREKELKSLEKKARKNNKLEQRLKKVYLPYDRGN